MFCSSLNSDAPAFDRRRRRRSPTTSRSGARQITSYHKRSGTMIRGRGTDNDSPGWLLFWHIRQGTMALNETLDMFTFLRVRHKV